MFVGYPCVFPRHSSRTTATVVVSILLAARASRVMLFGHMEDSTRVSLWRTVQRECVHSTAAAAAAAVQTIKRDDDNLSSEIAVL